MRSMGRPDTAQTTRRAAQQGNRRNDHRWGACQCTVPYASLSNPRHECARVVSALHVLKGKAGNVPVRQHRCFSSLSAARDPESPSLTVQNQLLKPAKLDSIFPSLSLHRFRPAVRIDDSGRISPRPQTAGELCYLHCATFQPSTPPSPAIHNDLRVDVDRMALLESPGRLASSQSDASARS